MKPAILSFWAKHKVCRASGEPHSWDIVSETLLICQMITASQRAVWVGGWRSEVSAVWFAALWSVKPEPSWIYRCSPSVCWAAPSFWAKGAIIWPWSTLSSFLIEMIDSSEWVSRRMDLFSLRSAGSRPGIDLNWPAQVINHVSN